MAGDEEDQRAVAVAAAPAMSGGRDALGWACHLVHLAVMVYFVTGWLAPARAGLFIYMGFVPAVALQWQVNRNTCVLSNLEALLRTGRWRNPANPEEGAWFATLCADTLGFRPSPLQVNVFLYSLLFVLWLMALIRLVYWKF
ncbi:MAG: hypothetical protein KGR48_09980 [Alphaproteobacteria bacterium]|nr:hypothetical protein [Alphaproteobacteria bacterium]MDE2012732.1 hypothetical protein [Alphaproteobacteria bacterium]